MTVGRVHILGAGVAGLAAATRLASEGYSIEIYEGAPQAGGRCRSYFDEALGRRIDNGNHLLLSGNWAVQDYLARIGATEELVGPDRATFPFFDAKSLKRWTVKPGKGRIPLWLACKHMRVPDTRFWDYLKAFRLRFAKETDTVASLLDDGGPLYQRFWEPLCLGVLNTHPNEAQAKLLWPVMAETFLAGEQACRPRVAKDGLSETFINPAIRYLSANGASIHLSSRLRAIETNGDRVTGLKAGDQFVPIASDDLVLSALPSQSLNSLLPELSGPDAFRTIVNAHFVLPEPLDNAPWLVGLVNAQAHWVFVRDDIASVTISAADDLAAERADSIAEILWPEVCGALGLSLLDMPVFRIVKEKRATFAQTPEQAAKRLSVNSPFKNMVLSGDWTNTGLPATIEGTIRSGFAAAQTIASVSMSSQ